ncbi:hypothetical protein O9992_10710 [Vibrio lentus]|nr:hypothetical protein [Vibrio lentus]
MRALQGAKVCWFTCQNAQLGRAQRDILSSRKWPGPLAVVTDAQGGGMHRLTRRETCDDLFRFQCQAAYVSSCELVQSASEHLAGDGTSAPGSMAVQTTKPK